MSFKHLHIKVFKSRGELWVIDGGAILKIYKCITGSNIGDKEIEGDRKTPEGLFHIVYKNPQSKFHLSMGLDYPNEDDANRGLAGGLLSPDIHRRLLEDINHGNLSDEKVQNRVWKTPLDGEIFIHGCAESRTSTAGCVALTNPDITELYALCPVGTPVDIIA